MKKFYPVIFTREEIGFSVFAPDMDGCFSEGDTFDEAYRNIQAAIGLYVDGSKQLPKASNPADITVEKNQFLCVVEFDRSEYLKKYSSKSVKKTLTIPDWLNAEAEKQHINFSSVLQEALKRELRI